MGIFGNVKIDNELQAGWRVALPASSEQSYDGDLWSSSQNLERKWFCNNSWNWETE